MRTGAFAAAALAAALSLLITACTAVGSPAEGGAVRYVTPAPTPTATAVPTATPTPLPPPDLLVSTVDTSQGGAILVSVTGGVVSGTASFAGTTYTLARGDQSMYTFLPVGIHHDPGTFPLEIGYTRVDGSTGTLSTEVAVAAVDWPLEHLYFDAEDDVLFSPAVVEAENAVITQQYGLSTADKLWDTWILPIDAPITSPFGTFRSINDGEPSTYHTGTDFGAPEGHPVVAASGGRVVFTGYLDLRGNFIIIDHGGGVLSGYAHLSAFAVEPGDIVETGQFIGEVGNTGRSTAAHLHWEIAVHGAFVDPMRFINGANGF